MSLDDDIRRALGNRADESLWDTIRRVMSVYDGVPMLNETLNAAEDRVKELKWALRSIMMVIRMGGNATCEDYVVPPEEERCPCPPCTAVFIAEEALKDTDDR